VWFRHAAIANGGMPELQAGNTPAGSLGSAPESLPPGLASTHPAPSTAK
jgi:hypothetical protein